MKRTFLSALTLCICSAAFASSTITTRPDDPKAVYVNAPAADGDSSSAFLSHFEGRKLKIRKGQRLYFNRKDLVVSAQPDLVAEEDGKLVLIKINASAKAHDGGMVPLLLACLS